MKELTKKKVNDLCYKIIGAIIEVHKELGPGLLEQVYEICLYNELLMRGLKVERQVVVPIYYKGDILDAHLKCDMLVDGCVLVELKAVLQMNPIFDAQTLTYMRLLKVPKGILVNFNCANIYYKGQKQLVNEYFDELPDE